VPVAAATGILEHLAYLGGDIQAMITGENCLPGEGQPLRLEDDLAIPEE